MWVVISIVCYPVVLMTFGCDHRNFSNLKIKKVTSRTSLFSVNFPENTSHFGYL